MKNMPSETPADDKILRDSGVDCNRLFSSGDVIVSIHHLKNGSDLANGTLAILFFLANGAGAMNSYCTELLSPKTGIAALNPNC